MSKIRGGGDRYDVIWKEIKFRTNNKILEEVNNMKKGSVVLLISMVILSVFAFVAMANTQKEVKKIKVMTFNIRYDGGTTPENSWEKRRDEQISLIKKYSPDVFGIQEGLKHQVDYYIDHLPNYGMILDEGRGGTSTSKEHNAVFYKRDSFYLREGGTFWLQPIADTVTWVRFAFRADGQEFYLFNTHLHQPPGEPAGFRLILEKARDAVNKHHIPLFLIGDMNEYKAQSVGWLILNRGEPPIFKDSWLYASEHKGPVKSSGFRERIKNPYDESLWYKRIDWVLFMGDVTPLSVETIADNKDGRYPSDHRPVLVEFAFEPSDYEPPELREPEFKYSNLKLSSSKVRIDEAFTVSATVKNSGGFGTTDVRLYVDGKVVKKTKLFLDSGASKSVSFTLKLYEPGEHKVTIGSLESETVEVIAESPF